MKKIVLMLLSVVMVASLASCGDNEEPTPKSNNYMMLYRVIMAKNTFNYGNPTLKVLNPVKNTTETIVLTEDMDNRNNTVYSFDCGCEGFDCTVADRPQRPVCLLLSSNGHKERNEV